MNFKFLFRNFLYASEAILGLHIWDLIPYKSIYKKSYRKLVKQAEDMGTSISNSKVFSENNLAIKRRKYALFTFSTGTPKEIRLLIGLSKYLQKNKRASVWCLCNSTPYTCESLQFMKKNKLKCYACTKKMKQVLSIFNENSFILKEYSKEVNIPDNIEKLNLYDLIDYNYKSINVGEIAKYSLYKKNKNDQIDQSWEKDLRRNIKSFILTFEATKKAIKKEKITDVIIMGGQYLNYRAVMLAAKQNNIDYFTYENFGVNRIIIAKNDECFNFPVKTEKKALTRSQRKEATQTFEDLRTGKYYHKKFNYGSIPAFLKKIADSKGFISVFPNVSWDSATFYKDSGIFKDQYEWLKETIRFCIETNKNLVIRIHPGEIRMNKKFRLVNFINEWFPALPANIVVFDSTDKISSYDIISKSDISCVYVSTIGIEIPYYEVPVIVVGQAYYKDYGFTINPKSKREYFLLISEYYGHKKKFKDTEYLLNYIIALQKYRRKIYYGEFLKYTGRQEFGLKRGHSWDFDESVYKGFPWEREGFLDLAKTLLE